MARGTLLAKGVSKQVMDRTWVFFVGTVLAATVGLSGAVTAARAADEDPNAARLMVPCYQALHVEEAVRPRIYPRSGGLAAAHQTLIDALKTNQRCSATLVPMASMRLANDAFLWSLLGQDEQLLNSPSWRHSIDVANGLLSRCASDPDLVKQGVSTRCQNQRSFNLAFARAGSGTDPCAQAQQAENSASDALSEQTVDPVHTQAAYKSANDGLAANARCRSPQMQLVTQGYLLSLKAEAEHDLNIAGWDHTFQQADDLLGRCSTTLRSLPDNVARNCATQLNANNALAREYRDAAGVPTGATSPLTYTALPWPYVVRADFNPDQLSTNDPFAKNVDYDTFAAVGSLDDLKRMFDFGSAGIPSNIDAKFFRANMLLFAVSRKTNQLCTSQAQDVHQFTPATAAGTLPVVVVDYALTCQPPAGPAQPAILALQIARSGGQVQFVENGVLHRSHYYLPAPHH